MEVKPGWEGQMDFSLGAWVLLEGRRKWPHLFRIVLSHSRKAYSEVVCRQTTESFNWCLEKCVSLFRWRSQNIEWNLNSTKYC